MMKSFKYIFAFVFILLLQGGPLAAQKKEIDPLADSLRLLLKKAPNDSIRIKLLHKLVLQIRYSDTEQAYKEGKDMLDLALKSKNKNFLSSAYTDVSNVCRQLGDYDKAISYGYNALAINEELKDSTSIAGSYLNLSTFFKAKHDFPKALDLLKEALTAFQHVKNKKGIAYVYNNLGTIYEEEEKDSLALFYLKKSLLLKSELKDIQTMGTVYMNIGIVQQHMNQLDSSEISYLKSMKICRKLNNLEGLSTVFINLGELARIRKNYKASRVFLDSALFLSEKLHNVDILEGSYNSLYLLNKETGNYEEALYDFEQHLLFKDSTLNETSSKQVAGMGARYESDKKDKVLQLLAKQDEINEIEDRKQRVFITGLVVLIAGVILLALLLYNRFRLRERVNSELSLVNTQINEQKKEITDSIRYARRIQESILLRPDKIQEILPQSFLLYRPKQIVSGDFYWVHKVDKEVIVAVVDNVLHGVPGAFISLVGINLLNRAILENPTRDLVDMVNFINDGIIQTLRQMRGDDSYSKKLNYAICRINIDTRIMECISTDNSVYLINESGVRELKRGEGFNPILHKLKLETNDSVFLFTDGYADQLGGKDGKKFMMRNLEQLLFKGAGLPLPEQKAKLESTLDLWKEKHEQVDDVLLIGFRV